MGPEVSLQLVTPGEPLAAEQPVADEGPLARVPPQVRLEVRRLAVDLAAAGDVTAVDVLLAEVDAGRAQPLRLLAVRAVAGRAARVPPLRPRGRHLRTYKHYVQESEMQGCGRNGIIVLWRKELLVLDFHILEFLLYLD